MKRAQSEKLNPVEVDSGEVISREDLTAAANVVAGLFVRKYIEKDETILTDVDPNKGEMICQKDSSGQATSP